MNRIIKYMLIVIAVCGCCVLEFQQFATNCNNTISVLQSIHQQTTKQTTKSKNKKTSKQPTKLNERQKEICNEVGLPTNVKQLNVGQRERLFRIEELLQHLDKKYNTTFKYRGYYQAFAPVYQKEKLEEYTDETGEFEYTTLTVENDGSFKDDYPFQLIKPIVRYDFIEYMKNNLERKFKVYVVWGETEIKDIHNINKKSLYGTTEVSCTAFVEHSNDLDITEIGDSIANWYKSLGIYGNTNVIAVNKGTLKNINYDNYGSIKRKQHLTNYLMCKVGEDGTVTIE